MKIPGNASQRFNPVLTAMTVVVSVLVIECLLFFTWFIFKIGAGNFALVQLPIITVSLGNSVVSWWLSLRAMRTYEPEDDARKVWRFVMLAMFMHSVGHLIYIVNTYLVGIVEIKPPTLSDWFGYIWVPVCLLIALYRKYRLVRTAGKPNQIFSFGQPFILVVFLMMAVLLSPFVSQIFFTIQLRLMALWMVSFIIATLHYSVAILSEIYTGLLSRSWKNLIFAVMMFALYYVAYFFFFTNNILAGQQWFHQVLQPMLAQIPPVFIGLAAYFEIEIIG